MMHTQMQDELQEKGCDSCVKSFLGKVMSQVTYNY